MTRRAGGRRTGASATDGNARGGGDAARARSSPRATLPAPLLATSGGALPGGAAGAWVFEPKYDGIRVVAAVADDGVTLAMRSGRDAAVAFPEIVGALEQLARVWRRRRAAAATTIVLDGEIVALEGELPARFAALQPRLFVASPIDAARRAREIATAFVAFDCLVLDGRSLVDRPWRARRAALDRVLARWQAAKLDPDVRGRLRASTVADDGAALLEAQRLVGGEGVIAKDPQAAYQPGRRSTAWRKVRLETIDEFAVLGVVAESGEGARPTSGGAAPRLPRRIGALVLGELDAAGALRVVGTVGAGLGGDAAAELARRLATLVRGAPADGVIGDEADASGRWAPRRVAPAAVTWVEPAVIVSVRYLERTAHGKLRQPVFVGIRADLSPRDLLRAPGHRRDGAPAAPAARRSPAVAPAALAFGRAPARPAIDGPRPTRAPVAPPRPTSRPRIVRDAEARESRRPRDAVLHGLPGVPDAVRAASAAALAALDEAADRRVGERERLTITVPDLVAHAAESLDAGAPGATPLSDACGWTWTLGGSLPLSLTHLGKPLGDDVVKGDLLRYYAAVSPYLLRALAGRPLVLRRHTDPAAGRAFYQQHVNAAAPTGVGTAVVGDDEKPRFVGGALATLLYLGQLGAVSMDPWHGRVDGLSLVDYSIIDLDPGPDAPFARAVDVARWVHDELLTLGLASVPKTSGASGIHVVVPLPGDTPAPAGRLLAELVASQVAARHRAAATVVRAVRARSSGAVYVDYLQNIPGKTVASVYAARATPTLTVSTPLTWDEVTPQLDPRDWTIRTVPPRLADVGDLWGDAMLRGNDLEALRRVLRSGDRREAEG